MKIWTGCTTTIPLEQVSPPAGSSWATELFQSRPSQLGVPGIPAGWKWDSGVPSEVSVARFEEVEDAGVPSTVELPEYDVETSGPSAQLAAHLRPAHGPAQTLWKEAGTVLQLDRSALSPAPQEPIPVKFRIWLQPMDEIAARGLSGTPWKNYPLDPMADPGSLVPALELSRQAEGTYAPASRRLLAAVLPSKTAQPIHAPAEIDAEDLALTLFPASRRLPNPILTSAG